MGELGFSLNIISVIIFHSVQYNSAAHISRARH